jgi:diketogulonate reductase-like aldo/keto reductase
MAAGHTKAIGVSNFNSELLAQLLADKRVKTVPAVSPRLVASQLMAVYSRTRVVHSCSTAAVGHLIPALSLPGR